MKTKVKAVYNVARLPKMDFAGERGFPDASAASVSDSLYIISAVSVGAVTAA
jgi:hypothetical protein